MPYMQAQNSKTKSYNLTKQNTAGIATAIIWRFNKT